MFSLEQLRNALWKLDGILIYWDGQSISVAHTAILRWFEHTRHTYWGADKVDKLCSILGIQYVNFVMFLDTIL